jgi:hypothetical protein
VAPGQGQYQPGFEDCTNSYTAADKLKIGQLCGPGAGHPILVNFLMGDGSVKSVNKGTDPASIMFISTRAGHDPVPPNVFN